ncbi:MAG: hypothetical protein ACP5JU_01135 [Minisyncoccia bacterium]
MEKRREKKKKEKEPIEPKKIIEPETIISLLSEEDGINKFFGEYIKLDSFGRFLVFEKLENKLSGGIPKKLLFKIMKYDPSLREKAWHLFCRVYGTKPSELFWIIGNIPELKEVSWKKFYDTFGNLIENIKTHIENIKRNQSETLQIKELEERLKNERNFIREELRKANLMEEKEIEEMLKEKGIL